MPKMSDVPTELLRAALIDEATERDAVFTPAFRLRLLAARSFGETCSSKASSRLHSEQNSLGYALGSSAMLLTDE